MYIFYSSYCAVNNDIDIPIPILMPMPMRMPITLFYGYSFLFLRDPLGWFKELRAPLVCRKELSKPRQGSSI